MDKETARKLGLLQDKAEPVKPEDKAEPKGENPGKKNPEVEESEE